MAAHNELGKEGELLAANHLQSEGYVIRHRNWRCGHKELDIVAEKDGTLVFVEVKTRKDVLFGLPEDAVTNGKIRRIVSSADAYLRKYAIDLPVRFDLITIVTGEGAEILKEKMKFPIKVTGENGLPRLRHIEDAFYPPLY